MGRGASKRRKVAVTFTRLGRRYGLEPQPFEIPTTPETGNAIAGVVHRYAKTQLASHDFGVTVYDDGTGTVEGGRFGEFAWKLI